MKRILFAATLLALAPAAFASLAEVRAAFEREHVEAFSRSVLTDFTIAPDTSRYEKASGKGAFAFAMPYARDGRLKFAAATFDGGRFVDGELFVMGQPAKKLTAEAFARLREEFAMVAVRTDVDAINPTAVLYPPAAAKPSFVITDDGRLDLDPVAFRLGGLGGSIARVGAATDRLAYEVTMRGRDGFEARLGVAGAKGMTQKQVMAAIRSELERRAPARKGMISERDIVDFRHGATVFLKAVPPPKPAK